MYYFSSYWLVCREIVSDLKEPSWQNIIVDKRTRPVESALCFRGNVEKLWHRSTWRIHSLANWREHWPCWEVISVSEIIHISGIYTYLAVYWLLPSLFGMFAVMQRYSIFVMYCQFLVFSESRGIGPGIGRNFSAFWMYCQSQGTQCSLPS